MDNCPITGKPCDKKKVIHVTDVGPDYTAEKVTHICETCNMGQIDPEEKQPEKPLIAFKSFTEILDMVFKNPDALKGHMVLNPASLPQNTQPPGRPPCSMCGCTIQDIAVLGKIGCQNCYVHFKQELSSVILYAQKSLTHKGKIPNNEVSKKDDSPITERIALLKLKLQELVREERYEEAGDVKVKLDDLIREHESE